MTVQATAPRKADIQAHARDDLRRVYLAVYTTGTVDVGDIVDKLSINNRYAKELLGILEHHKLIVRPDEAGAEWTYNLDSFADRADNDEEAAALIDHWLEANMGPAPQTPQTATKNRSSGSSLASTKSPTGHCLCGCGSPTRKSFAPGHDARFAGQVARALAELYIRDFDGDTGAVNDRVDELLQRLPSPELRAKAKGHAVRLVEKASTKGSQVKDTVSIHTIVDEVSADLVAQGKLVDHKADPVYVYGTVKVGRKEYPARRDADNEVMRANRAFAEYVKDGTSPVDIEYTGTVEGKPAATFKLLEVQP